MKQKPYILESDIIRAMKYTKSNAGASRFLKVDMRTYMKYARMYKDADGISYAAKHYNRGGKGISRTRINYNRFKLEDILNNKYPKYKLNKLKHILLNNGILIEQCNVCNFSERRITDSASPLILSFKNGKRDYSLENLELLCYNCYFLLVGNPMGRPYKIIEPIIEK